MTDCEIAGLDDDNERIRVQNQYVTMTGYTKGMTDPEEVRQHIANLIRSRRLALRMDQNALAARSGLSQAALSRYEAASSSMRAEDVPRLAAALETEPWEFFTATLRSNMGVNWTAVEAEMVTCFRSLPPGERMDMADLVQRRAAAHRQAHGDDFMAFLERISVGGIRPAEAKPTSEDSGLVSKKVEDEERETL